MTDPLARLQELLRLITYKPGWSISLVRDEQYRPYRRPHQFTPDRFYLLVRWSAKDTIDTEKEVTLTWLEPFLIWDFQNVSDKDLVQNFIFRAIFHAEQHEMHEWFKIDGFCVFEPHPELVER